MRRVKRFAQAAAVFIAAGFLGPIAATADQAGSITITLTATRFDCKEPLFTPEKGFERCELYTVPRFTAPRDALVKVFGHCDATIRYKTRDGLLENRQSLYEEFYGAIVDGKGLAPVTMTFRPSGLLLDPIVEARVTELVCSVDQVFRN